MKELVKGKNSYITVDEALEWLSLEGYETENIDTKKMEYALIKATSKIEKLNIKTYTNGKGNLKFPLPFQQEVPLEIELCCSLEAYFMLENKISDELETIRKGIVSESEKTASVTYNTNLVNTYKNIDFNNIEAYKLIEKYVSNTYRIK